MIYDTRIARLGIRALFDLQGKQTDLSAWAGAVLPAFPDRPNTAAGTENRLLWLGQESWLLMAPLEAEQELSEALRPSEAPDCVSICLVSDSLVFFRITGAEAPAILAMASPLDVHPRVFPEDGATWAEVFGQRALVLRQSDGFEIGVDRSLDAMTQDYLARITS